MVKDEAIQTILSIFEKYIVDDDVKFIPRNNWLIYYFKIHHANHTYNVHFAYEFMDSYYRIKIEFVDNTPSDNVIFLTQSKTFHKKVKKFLKTNKLNKKSRIDHIIAVSTILQNSMNIAESFNKLIEMYPQDLKFDGYFV